MVLVIAKILLELLLRLLQDQTLDLDQTLGQTLDLDLAHGPTIVGMAEETEMKFVTGVVLVIELKMDTFLGMRI